MIRTRAWSISFAAMDGDRGGGGRGRANYNNDNINFFVLDLNAAKT